MPPSSSSPTQSIRVKISQGAAAARHTLSLHFSKLSLLSNCRCVEKNETESTKMAKLKIEYPPPWKLARKEPSESDIRFLGSFQQITVLSGCWPD